MVVMMQKCTTVGSCCWYVVENKGIVEGEGKWAPIVQKQYEQTELLVMPRALSAGDWCGVWTLARITTTGAWHLDHAMQNKLLI